MRKTLAVLITYFNEKELLTECLKSLLSQPEGPDEILVYDDASQSPASRYIPEEWPVKVIRGEVNGGAGRARNVLLEQSENDYIHFHDADDLFHPDWCKRIRNVIDVDEPDIVITEVSAFKNGKLICKEALGLKQILVTKDLVRFALSGIILTPSITVKRNIALKTGGFRSREVIEYSEDFDFNVRLAATGATYNAIFEPLVIQNVRPKSLSYEPGKACWVDMVKSIGMLSSELPSQYKNDLAETAARCGHTLFNINARKEAKEAFRLAKRLGVPEYRYQRPPLRILAKILNPEAAEHIGVVYRYMIPERLRKFLVK